MTNPLRPTANENAVRDTIAAYDLMADGYFARWFNNDVMHLSYARLAALHHTREIDVLDAACGVGRDSKYLCELGHRVVGIDLSKELLAKARTNVPDVVFRQMDILDIQYPADSFGLVWCSAALHHIPPPLLPGAIAEFARVLQADGLLFLSLPILTRDTRDHIGRSSFAYSSHEVISLLSKFGFVPIDIREITDAGRHHTHTTGPWLSGFFRATKPPRQDTYAHCRFCSPERFPANIEEAYPNTGAIFHRLGNLYLTTDIAPLVFGHFLIISDLHVTAFAKRLPQDLSELEAMCSFVNSVYEREFGTSALFVEHGAGTDSLGGACIDHAHIHCLPLTDDVANRVLEEIAPRHDRGWAAAARISSENRPYLLTIRGNDIRACDASDFSTQHLRRVVSAVCDTGPDYQWFATYHSGRSKKWVTDILSRMVEWRSNRPIKS
jgi:SAM-dependent methyltransferase